MPDPIVRLLVLCEELDCTREPRELARISSAMRAVAHELDRIDRPLRMRAVAHELARIDRPLSFLDLRRQNLRRCEESFHQLNHWNVLEWAGAMCGEAGEAANAAKKLRRGDGDGDRKDVLKELADVVIYADLLAARLGADLGEEVREKFNEVSARCGSERTL